MNFVHRLLITVPLIVWTSTLAADPLAQWHWRNPLPTANSIFDVIYANGQFIAVDEGGEILTSPNGFDWTVRNCGYACGLNGVAFGNGTYVAVGDADGYTALALTSPDGVTWTPESIDAPHDTALQSVCFGNGLFVAGTSGSDQSPGILTSPDGVNWAAQVPAGVVGGLGIEGLDSVAYGNGLFVAVGPSPTQAAVLTSPDGTNWTTVDVGISGVLNGVSFIHGAFVAVGLEPALQDAAVLLSGDGSTWTNGSFHTVGGYCDLHSATYGAGLYVVAGSGTAGGAIYSSPDGKTWTESDIGAAGGLLATAYANGVFVASEATTVPSRECFSSRALVAPSLTQSTRLIWPAPTPTSTPSRA